MLLMPIALIAQVEPPTDIPDLIENFDILMGSLAGISAISLFITGILNGLLKTQISWVRQLISWVVPILLSTVFGFWLNIGFLADAPLYIALLYGLGAGLISNGLFDVSFVNSLILFIEKQLGNKY